MDKLNEIFFLQKKYGSKFVDFDDLQNDESGKQYKIIEFIDHTIEELYELRRELPARKHWSTEKNNKPDWSLAIGEYIDALHFFVSIGLLLNLDAEKTYDAYLYKHEINKKRQMEDY